MKDILRHIIENRKDKIKTSDYITIILPTGGLIVGGITMLYNTFKFNHPDLLIPSLLTIGISVIVMIFLLRKLKTENSYDFIETRLSRKENINLCEEVAKELFTNIRIHENKDDCILSCEIEAIFSWGKELTFISEEKRILFNYRDSWAPLTLFGRKRNMNRIKKAIDKKANC